ncbi:MAG TPA: secondary thiamine-phosphate synthase enzyme YjbQ [Verrucomicrobiae bacterium]|nr:secondary thiamine-phosphate synthase enzyme YjbQ [Verrucomicrobiae bacterium]
MAAHTETFAVATRGRGAYEITEQVVEIVGRSGVQTGVATVFVAHTSASLVIFENADPTAREDLETFLGRLVPDGASWFTHDLEGPDDMPSHIRMALTRTSENIPVHHGRPCLGAWQGIYLLEHRRTPHRRSIAVAVVGEK